MRKTIKYILVEGYLALITIFMIIYIYRLKQFYGNVSEGGEFEKIEDVKISGDINKESEEEFAVAVVKARYEHKVFTYTITFTKQMKLAGLYCK